MGFGKWLLYSFKLTAFCAGIEDDAEREEWIQRLGKAPEGFASSLRGWVDDFRQRQAAGTLCPGELERMTPAGQAGLMIYANSILNPPSRSLVRKRARRERKKLRRLGLLKPPRKLRKRKRG